MKDQIRILIAEGNLEEALGQLQSLAASLPIDEFQDEITLLQTRFAIQQRKARRNTDSPEQLERNHNQLAEATLEVLRHIPDAASFDKKYQKSMGIREQNLKRHIFLLLILVKAVIFIWLFTHWESKGFLTDQFIGTLVLFFPVMITYFGLMFQDFLEYRHAHNLYRNKKRVSKNLQWLVYTLILAHGLALWILIGMKAKGTLPFSWFAVLSALVESGLGLFLGKMVRFFVESSPLTPKRGI